MLVEGVVYRMYSLVNKIISKIKGENFELDKNIPFTYLLGIVIKRILMLIKGFIIFRRFRAVFVDKGVNVLCKSKFTFKSGLSIGQRCFIDAVSKNGINIGYNFSLGKNSAIECTGSIKNLGIGLSIGDNVGIGSCSFLGCAGGISIGSDTIIGNFVSFHSENHNFSDNNVAIRLQGVNRQGITVGQNCWIGAKVTILDGANIGSGCVVAAGAVVKAGIYPDNSVIVGVPAKIIKKRC